MGNATTKVAPLCTIDEVDSMLGDDLTHALASKMVYEEGRRNDADEPDTINKYVQRLIHEYLIFMWLRKSYPAQDLSAPVPIDAVWQHHTTFTRQYAHFCARHFDSFQHHDPVIPSKPVSHQTERARAKAYICYSHHTKLDPPEEFWPSSDALARQLKFLRGKVIKTENRKVIFLSDQLSKSVHSREIANAGKRFKTSSSSNSYMYGTEEDASSYAAIM